MPQEYFKSAVAPLHQTDDYRLKALQCFFAISKLRERTDIDFDELMQGIVDLIPPTLSDIQPYHACILIEEGRYCSRRSSGYQRYLLRSEIRVSAQIQGELFLFDHSRQPVALDPQYCNDVQSLMDAIAERVGRIIERYRAEQELQRREALYRLLTDNSTDMIVKYSSEGTIQYVTPSCKQLLGYRPEEVIGKSLYDIIHPDDLVSYGTAQTWLDGASPMQVEEFRARAKDGTYIWTETSTRTIKDPDNAQEFVMVAVCRDIRIRKRAESALRQAHMRLEERIKQRTRDLQATNHKLREQIAERRRIEVSLVESQRRLEEILESISDGFFTLDKNWRYTFLNSRAARLVGKSSESLIGRVFWDEFPEAVDGPMDNAFRNVMTYGKVRSFQVYYVQLDCWFEGTVYPYSDGISIFFRDISEQKKAEEALKESEIRYRTVVEYQTDLICRFRQDSTITFANQAFCRYFHQPFNHLVGSNLFELIPLEDQTLRKMHLSALHQGRTMADIEHRVIDGNGDIRWLRWTDHAIFDLMGRLVEFQTVGQDITDRKEAEAALQHSTRQLVRAHEQRRLLSQKLISLLEKDRHSIAMELHDHVGQTLTSIKIGLEMLEDRLKKESTETSLEIRELKNKTVRVIKDVKQISYGLKPSMLQALGLLSALRELFAEVELQSGFGIHFFHRNVPNRFEHEKELAVYRIAQESLSNIRRYAEAEQVYINLVVKDQLLQFSIEDDGIGFDYDSVVNRPNKRGPFGLLIMRERAIQAGGEFHVEAQPGKGSHIRVEMPL
jgi:PAS domain S-box-containing protein